MTSKVQQEQQKLNQNMDKSNLPLSETDPHAAKQKAAEDKLQLLAIVQTMQREGKLPHNHQLYELLEKLITNKVISSREHLVSEDGSLLLNDFRDLLRTLQKALDYKNKDELFQSLVYHLHCIESPISKEHINQSIEAHDKNTVKEEGKKISSSLFKILKLLIINNNFRNVLGDLLDISQDIFNDVIGKVGDSLKNTGDNLQNRDNKDNCSGRSIVDRTLDKVIDHAETPKDRESKHHSLHDQEPHIISSPNDDPRYQGLLNTGDSVHPAVIPGSFPQGQDSYRSEERIQDTGSDQPTYRGDSHDINRQSHQDSYDQQNYKDKMSSHPMYQGARNELEEQKEHMNQTMQQRVPKDKQDELIHRLQRALAEVQGHPDYQECIDTIINLIKVWSSRLANVTGDIKQQSKHNDHPEQADYRNKAETEVKAIIEIWAQGYSIDPLLHAVRNISEDVRNDEHLRSYYHSVTDYLYRLVKEPGYINTDKSVEDGKQLIESGRHIVKGRYSDHLDCLSGESSKYLHLMAEDEISQEIAHRFQQIHRDLWMDRDGNPAFKPHLFNDMKMTLLPTFVDEIKYIPIPRIEYSDPHFDIVIENLILSGDTLLPNLVETKIESFSSFSLRSDTVSKPDHQSLFIRMNEIQADISDVVFFYKKKTGFPKLSDSGVASVTIDGKGIDVAVRVKNVTDNPARTFKVSYCKCNVNNIKIKINDSNHDVLYKTIRPLVIGQIRKQIARGIEAKIIEMVNRLDQKVTKSIVNFNQELQTKAYESLPEDEKVRQHPPSISQARPRPGIFSTLVSIMNKNIKSKIEKRNSRKRDSTASSPDSLSRKSGLNDKIDTQNVHQYSQQDPNYSDSSFSTSRQHNIDSPPHSPKKYSANNNDEQLLNVQNAQQGQQFQARNQL